MVNNVKYASLIKNDVVNGEGICVSLWTQGCPFKCPGCHNPETWSFEGGIDTLVNEANYEDGFWGIGSKYSVVKNAIGEGTVTLIQEQYELNISTVLYTCDNATLLLTVNWFDDSDIYSGIVTDIEWEASAAKNILRGQDNLERFNGYNDTYVSETVIENFEDNKI